jgi:hypothetical protein
MMFLFLSKTIAWYRAIREKAELEMANILCSTPENNVSLSHDLGFLVKFTFTMSN